MADWEKCETEGCNKFAEHEYCVTCEAEREDPKCTVCGVVRSEHLKGGWNVKAVRGRKCKPEEPVPAPPPKCPACGLLMSTKGCTEQECRGLKGLPAEEEPEPDELDTVDTLEPPEPEEADVMDEQDGDTELDEQEDDDVVSIDFNGYSELIPKIEQLAQDNVRSFSLQVIFLVREGLKSTETDA